MPEEQQFKPIKMWIASSREAVEAMKREGVEPILLMEENSQISVWFKTENAEVLQRVGYGNSWSTGEDTPDEYGYIFYVYARLDLDQLVQHISDPNKFRGDD